ncbi:MAG: hypothetical protein MUC77_18390 [Chromatiaceae bacterium]|jgi:hypothetical protein|nr:hypothetical protein [Chromatiaceae bacterium]
MDWLRELPWGVFWFGWGMLALLAFGSLFAVWWAKRNVKAIRAQTPVGVSNLAEGYRLGWGRTVGPDLKAPLTRRPCVWWKAQVWESVRERDPAEKKYRYVWREVASEESDRPVLFGDEAAVAGVWPWGATVMPSGWSDWRGQELPPEQRSPELRKGGAPGQGIRHDVQGTVGPRFRYVEQIIERDAPIFALGEVTRADPALYAPDEEEEGMADEDAGGVEHDEHWRPEPSRLGVTATPDAAIATDMARAQWSISKAKGQPFLLSTEHPNAVSAEQELGAKGGLIMGALFLALALFLAWARLMG